MGVFTKLVSILLSRLEVRFYVLLYNPHVVTAQRRVQTDFITPLAGVKPVMLRQQLHFSFASIVVSPHKRLRVGIL